MSEDVYYTGKLIPVKKKENETTEQLAKRVLESNGFHEKDSSFESYVDQIDSDLYHKYIVIDDIIYKVDKKDVDIYSDIFESSDNEDGTINFTVKYYNGGCGFYEAIESALKNKT